MYIYKRLCFSIKKKFEHFFSSHFLFAPSLQLHINLIIEYSQNQSLEMVFQLTCRHSHAYYYAHMSGFPFSSTQQQHGIHFSKQILKLKFSLSIRKGQGKKAFKIKFYAYYYIFIHNIFIRIFEQRNGSFNFILIFILLAFLIVRPRFGCLFLV